MTIKMNKNIRTYIKENLLIRAVEGIVGAGILFGGFVFYHNIFINQPYKIFSLMFGQVIFLDGIMIMRHKLFLWPRFNKISIFRLNPFSININEVAKLSNPIFSGNAAKLFGFLQIVIGASLILTMLFIL
ncbi:MAG: hypothetical protein AAB430_03415 [Patescibacteria group bacterium]